MPPSAPHSTAFLRERLPLHRSARAHPGESDAYTFQRLCVDVRQRVHLQPSERCLEQLEAPMVMDCLASLEPARGNSPRTRHTR
jgi:integrase/recombinase XerD